MFHSTNRVVKRIAAGWQFSGIATFQCGQALSFSGAKWLGAVGNQPHVFNNWFDRTEFVAQQPFTLHHTSSRIAQVRGPGINKFDLTVAKRIMITERVLMTFHSKFYNAFNHTNFSNPNTSVSSGSFDTISGVNLQPRNIQLSGRITF